MNQESEDKVIWGWVFFLWTAGISVVSWFAVFEFGYSNLAWIFYTSIPLTMLSLSKFIKGIRNSPAMGFRVLLTTLGISSIILLVDFIINSAKPISEVNSKTILMGIWFILLFLSIIVRNKNK